MACGRAPIFQVLKCKTVACRKHNPEDAQNCSFLVCQKLIFFLVCLPSVRERHSAMEPFPDFQFLGAPEQTRKCPRTGIIPMRRSQSCPCDSSHHTWPADWLSHQVLQILCLFSVSKQGMLKSLNVVGPMIL